MLDLHRIEERSVSRTELVDDGGRVLRGTDVLVFVLARGVEEVRLACGNRASRGGRFIMGGRGVEGGGLCSERIQRSGKRGARPTWITGRIARRALALSRVVHLGRRLLRRVGLRGNIGSLARRYLRLCQLGVLRVDGWWYRAVGLRGRRRKRRGAALGVGEAEVWRADACARVAFRKAQLILEASVEGAHESLPLGGGVVGFNKKNNNKREGGGGKRCD